MALLSEIRSCTYCTGLLPQAPRPILQYSPESRILLVGQAPGIKAHETGIPWNDASGERLREWMGVEPGAFYDEKLFALVPMGFCYPGRGAAGDNAPRRECAPRWHHRLIQDMKHRQLVILVGSYAQEHYLPIKGVTLTETVRGFREYLPGFFVLPHPSPRNNIWLKRNQWFQDEVLPELKQRVRAALDSAALEWEIENSQFK